MVSSLEIDMKFTLRRVGNYADFSVAEGGSRIDLGLLSRKQVLELLEELRSAVEDVEWFAHVTDKEPA